MIESRYRKINNLRYYDETLRIPKLKALLEPPPPKKGVYLLAGNNYDDKVIITHLWHRPYPRYW